MNKWLLQLALVLGFCLAGLGLFPQSAAATLNAPPRVELVTPASGATRPVVKDFADSDFEQADQAELGQLVGGDGGGIIIFILVVVLLVLLIIWLLNASDGGHSHIVVRNSHESRDGHADHAQHMQ